MSNKSKYSRDDRKHIVESIENLKNDQDYTAIFEILTSDDNILYSHNSNGIFLNLSNASDKTLEKIQKYLKKANTKRGAEESMETEIIPNVYPNKNERVYKLSNYEKNILKQRNLKKVLNEENEYEELKLVSKKKKNDTVARSKNY